jgi:hypothetical protein
LRRRELGVEQHKVSPCLHHCDQRLYEPAVIASEQPDTPTRSDAPVAQFAGETIAVTRELSVGQAGLVVDHRRG